MKRSVIRPYPFLLLAAIFGWSTAFSQTSDKPWMAGLEVIYLDYQGPVTGKYLQFPAMDPGIKMSAHAFLNQIMNLSINSAFVPNTVYPETSEKFLSTSLIDANAMIQFKSNGTFFAEDALLAPYLSTGIGVNSASNIYRPYVPISLGTRVQITPNFGLNLEATYKQSFKKEDYQHIALSAGFVFSIPTEQKDEEQEEIPEPEEPKDSTEQLVAEPQLKDSDGDGVPDEIDNCPNVKGLHTYLGCPGEPNPVPIISPTPPIETKPDGGMTVEEANYIDNAVDNIYFEYGSKELRSDSYTTLDSVAMILIRYPNYKLEVLGHTDNTGTYEANQILSVLRAFEVKKYLVKQKGVRMARIISNGVNYEQPEAANDNEAGRSKNRRVTFKLIAPNGDTVFKN